jgi:thioredoxin reductase
MNHANHVSVVTEDQTIDTRMILLAVGMNNQPPMAALGDPAQGAGCSDRSCLRSRFSCLNAIQKQGPIAVVGSGISGAQLALHLAEKGFEDILLVSRKAIQVSDFDFNPGWLGPQISGSFQPAAVG